MRRTKPVPTTLALAAALALGLQSAAVAQEPAAEEPPSIVVTTAVLGSVVDAVVGDAAEVTTLMPGGADPHAWQPSARDAGAVMDAALVIENGLNLEEGLMGVLDRARADGAHIFTASDFVEVRMNEDTDHDHEHGDEEHEGHDHGDEAKDEDEDHDHDHGDGDEDHDHEAMDDGHDHGGHDHSGLAHACGHFDDDPTVVAADGTIPNDHTRYSIELADGSAAVTVDRSEAGGVAFFLGSDVPLELTDATGTALMVEQTTTGGDECPAIATVAVYALEPGVHTLAIGPADVAEVDLVWEEASLETSHEDHDHDHGDEAKEEDHDHDHGDEAKEEDHDHGDDAHDHHGHSHGPEDPHIWLDPVAMGAIVEALVPELAEIGVDVADRADALKADLDALDAEIATLMAAIPDDQRKIITGHEVLGYFSDRYGLEQIGTVIPGFVTMGETTAQDVEQVVEAIEEVGVSVVFTDMGTNESVAEAIANDTGAAIVRLNPAQVPDGGTYVEFMRDLAKTISGALAS